MLFILISIMLLESVIFGIVLSGKRNKIRFFIMGAFLVILLAIAGAVQNDALIFGGFIGGHIILFAMYLVDSYQQIIQIEEKNLKTVFLEYVKIPIFFYLIPIAAVFYTLAAASQADEARGVMIILFMVCIAAIYTFIENKTFNKLSDEMLMKMELQNLKQYIYRKNALVAVYAIIFTASVGVLYTGMIDLKENTEALMVFLEFTVAMVIYGVCYRRVKTKFMPEDNSQYSKWQLFVPKRVGVGVSFNFSSPLTYLILGIVLVLVIISLL